MEKFIQGKTKFDWGQVVKVHEIGEYQIIEYFAIEYKNGFGTDKFKAKPSFHVHGKNRSYSSLDMALIGAICIKHDGMNTAAPAYIAKMVNLDL